MRPGVGEDQTQVGLPAGRSGAGDRLLAERNDYPRSADGTCSGTSPGVWVGRHPHHRPRSLVTVITGNRFGLSVTRYRGRRHPAGFEVVDRGL